MNKFEEIDVSLQMGELEEAYVRMKEAWVLSPTAATAAFILSRDVHLEQGFPLPKYRMYILRSFTIEPMVPLLRADALACGIRLDVRVGNFNAYTQDVLGSETPLYEFAPHFVILAVQTRDVAPELWDRVEDLSSAEAKGVADRVGSDFRQLLTSIRKKCSASLIVHTLEQPAWPSGGIRDAQAVPGQCGLIMEINNCMRQAASGIMGVYLLDYDALVARHGRLSWRDEKKWLTMRMPIAAPHHASMAREWMRFVHVLAGKTCKVLAIDLDNTLWGGVIGEDGLEGIHVGLEYPGAAFRALQRVILDLHQAGIILAICSKNNYPEAMEVLEKHPGMLLRSAHFSAVRINWQDKATNLREIATELNVGLDAVAFLDDNPVEREFIRVECSDVRVIDLPSDPMEYADALRRAPFFDRLSLSTEDGERGRMYAAQRQRQNLQHEMGSLEDFLRELAQVVTVASLCPANLKRMAQLTQKTNQFNLTTRRYAEQDLMQMQATPGMHLHSISVADRLGDNGIVGVLIWRIKGPVCMIDTFLISCRIIGRTIETAMLAWLLKQLRKAGVEHVEGWFLPTKKNAPAIEFYLRHGFLKVEETTEGSRWVLELGGADVDCPKWITLREDGES